VNWRALKGVTGNAEKKKVWGWGGGGQGKLWLMLTPVYLEKRGGGGRLPWVGCAVIDLYFLETRTASLDGKTERALAAGARAVDSVSRSAHLQKKAEKGGGGSTEWGVKNAQKRCRDGEKVTGSGARKKGGWAWDIQQSTGSQGECEVQLAVFELN